MMNIPHAFMEYKVRLYSTKKGTEQEIETNKEDFRSIFCT